MACHVLANLEAGQSNPTETSAGSGLLVPAQSVANMSSSLYAR